MILSGWGNYPTSQSEVHRFNGQDELRAILAERDCVIPRGNGRSYGDSSLGEHVVDVKRYNLFIDFDSETGTLHVQAGALLSDVLDVFVSRGWFLKITPGTKLITVGGAIASDVHGKNHHVSGCFSECVEMFHLMMANGNVARCSRTENSDLFRATCGGMGLTGVILDARIQLLRIQSANILQTMVKSRDIEETLTAFEDYADKPYSVAWIDCLSSGSDLGRSLLAAGDFNDDGQLDYRTPANRNVPRCFPSVLTNKMSARVFNELYFSRVRKKESDRTVGIDTFFYPLDAIDNWNRVYGKRGFVQYQFVLPKESSHAGLVEILTEVSRSGPGSFLAVIKLFGPANDNMLSFPIEGYSLAMDFKIVPGLFDLLNDLDKFVMKHGGRIYLTKDARAARPVIYDGYSRLQEFRTLRKNLGLDLKFNSVQSRRLEI